MVDERDIWRAAQVMMKRYAESEKRAAKLEAASDWYGAATFRKIAIAAREHAWLKPKEGDRVH